MSDTLIESQLFGHERGAFTGAQQTVKGKFELANEGTLFLDEIADMSPLAQVKILRVLEYGEFERLGSEQMLHADARIICATNCSLLERVRQKTFREDLYHRLNGLTLLIPPLRERMEELPALIAAELKASASNENKKINAIHPEAMDKLLTYPWPGNLRELSHTVRTMILFCEGRVPVSEAVTTPSSNGKSEGERDLSLAAAVARHVQLVYEQSGRNQRRTARLLHISRATLARHLKGRIQK